MSAYVLLYIINELGKKIKCEACRSFYLFLATSFINSIIQEHECSILFISYDINLILCFIYSKKIPNSHWATSLSPYR